MTDEKINLTVVALLFVAGLVAALAVPQAAHLIPQRSEPVEELSIYRIEFREDDRVVAHVLNTGPVPAEIGAVQIGGPFPAAIRDHTVGQRTLQPLESTTVEIPFRWQTNVPYEVTVIATTGAAFSGDAVAVPSQAGNLALPIGLGIAIGIVPVALGIAPYPIFQRLGDDTIRLLGGLAAGVLAFLLVDTLGEAAEVAQRLPLTVGPTLVVGGFLAGLLPLVWYGRTKLGDGVREQAPIAAAYLVAIAIGLHNFGEGLAVGAAQASGALALAALLAVGFALHNVTEGVAIVAPALEEKIGWRHPVALVAIAGGPVIPGAMISFSFYSDALAALFFSVAVGAILYVVVEIVIQQARDAPGGGHDDPMLYGGLALGLIVMYATDVVLHVLVGGG